ncbi:hypothetical protein V6N12_009377 [Hibiscus sabdariffa]|uniref:Uncharacterized protein n=1 Tax=Hibiscus sabdariffa TaxID=183260 RepID=A0ABR2E9F4_9ROSI
MGLSSMNPEMGFNSSPVNPGRVSPLSSDPRHVSHLLPDPCFQSRSLGQRSVSDLGLHSGTINRQDVSGFGHAKSVDTNPGSSQVSSSFKALPCFGSEHQTSNVPTQLGLGQSDVGLLSSAQSASGLPLSLVDLENSTSIEPVAYGSQEVQPTDGPFVVNQHPMWSACGSGVGIESVWYMMVVAYRRHRVGSSMTWCSFKYHSYSRSRFASLMVDDPNEGIEHDGSRVVIARREAAVVPRFENGESSK